MSKLPITHDKRNYRVWHESDPDAEDIELDTIEKVEIYIRRQIELFAKGFTIKENPREYAVTFEDINDIRTCEVVKL